MKRLGQNERMTTMIKLAIHLSLLTITLQDVTAFGTTPDSGSSKLSSRNDFMKQVATGAIALATTIPQAANADIIRSNKCAYGEGLGCDDLAGDNELIKQLQRKSAERKEAEQKEYLSAYQMKNYPGKRETSFVTDRRLLCLHLFNSCANVIHSYYGNQYLLCQISLHH